MNYRQLLNTGQHYLNWNLKSLCHILPPLRSNYDAFLNRIEIGWTTYSKDGTKIGVYKEVHQLSHTYICILWWCNYGHVTMCNTCMLLLRILN